MGTADTVALSTLERFPEVYILRLCETFVLYRDWKNAGEHDALRVCAHIFDAVAYLHALGIFFSSPSVSAASLVSIPRSFVGRDLERVRIALLARSVAFSSALDRHFVNETPSVTTLSKTGRVRIGRYRAPGPQARERLVQRGPRLRLDPGRRLRHLAGLATGTADHRRRETPRRGLWTILLPRLGVIETGSRGPRRTSAISSAREYLGTIERPNRRCTGNVYRRYFSRVWKTKRA